MLLDARRLRWRRIGGGIGRLAVLALLAGLLLEACDNNSDTAGPTSSPSNTKTSEKSTGHLVQKPQPVLEQMFTVSTNVVLSVKTSEQFAVIKPYDQAVLTIQPNGLKITAQGSDPAVLLPSFPTEEAVAEVIMDSPADTTFQLFYRLPGEIRYSQSSSINVPIKAGKNTVYVELPASIGVLRLDPGQVSGDYLLESLQVRHVTSPNRIP